MEISIAGKNWWRINKRTKHLIASTAKKLYEPYWNEYFKFTFIRNPWDRMVSMSRFSKFYGVKVKDGSINPSQYFNKFSPLEVDPRSESAKDEFKPIKNAVYLNILNEELDFIGRFENMHDDFSEVCKTIGKPQEVLINNKKHKSNHQHYTEYYDDETRSLVAEKYAKDIEYFNYEFGE